MSLPDEEITQMRDAAISAIELLVLPRFDAVERDSAKAGEDLRALKEDMRILQPYIREVQSSLIRLEGSVKALESDIKEIYGMVKPSSGGDGSGEALARLSVEQKILKMYRNFQSLAKEAGITLPS